MENVNYSILKDLEETANDVEWLRRKLKSKAEALYILSEELVTCRRERDCYKNLLSEHSAKWIDDKLDGSEIFVNEGNIKSAINTNAELKSENSELKNQVLSLQKRIRDYEMDLKVLRMQNKKFLKMDFNPFASKNFETETSNEKNYLIEQLEILHLKHKNLEEDFRAILDEKVEITDDLERCRGKIQRLNHQLHVALGTGNKNLCDIDSLIAENKYLRETVHNLQAEMESNIEALAQCQNLLQDKKQKGFVKLSFNNLTGMLVSYKQVQQFLESDSSFWFPNKEVSRSDLKNLATALLDALQDESIALANYKKTNKLLAQRLRLLEEKLRVKSSDNEIIFGKDEKNDFYRTNNTGKVIKYSTRYDRYSDINHGLTEDTQKLFFQALNDIPGEVEIGEEIKIMNNEQKLKQNNGSV